MSTAQGERGWAVPASVGCAAEVVMSSARLLLSASVLSEHMLHVTGALPDKLVRLFRDVYQIVCGLSCL